MEANHFTILWWFLPHVDMHQPWVSMFPCVPKAPPSPSPSHPSGLSQSLALSALFHASNLDWSSISHMIIFMFQCYSLKSSHSHLLPQSPKVCSLNLCLFCCLANRVQQSMRGIHTEETRIERDTCTPMFIAALFTIARAWKQPRCPSADEWIRKLWYINTTQLLKRMHLNQF